MHLREFFGWKVESLYESLRVSSREGSNYRASGLSTGAASRPKQAKNRRELGGIKRTKRTKRIKSSQLISEHWELEKFESEWRPNRT